VCTPGFSPGSRSGFPLSTTPTDCPLRNTSTPSMLASKMRAPILGGGGAPGLAPLGVQASSMLGSKLPRSLVGFCNPFVASRTLTRTYSASSSAVTMPSPFSSAAPSIPFTT
jgi:hypothetical protein